MRAVVHRRYGGPEVLELVDVDTPVPADDEVLVRVRATSVNPTEWYDMTGLVVARARNGLRTPKEPRLGADLAGVVEAVGRARTDFAPGDEVYGARTGAFAESVAVRNTIAPKPANLTFEQAAAIPIAATTALQALRDKGRLQPGESVLVAGASGGVARSPYRSRRRSGRVTSPLSAARGTSRLRMRTARTTSSTTRRRTSPRAAGGTT
jgi:NADPH:quinone reductase-like Zn-dependent oxidoreductase